MTEVYAVSVVLAGGIQLPTFYLFSAVQGIVSEDHAERIARSMLTKCGHPDASICAVATSFNAHHTNLPITA